MPFHRNAHEILFEPLEIGPVVSRNRLLQAPHGSGMGHREPSAMAEMRRIKAEGGWGIVSTESVEIHPSTDRSPIVELRNWDDRDIPTLAAMASAVHLHGALAAIDLSHSGLAALNHAARDEALAPSAALALPGTLPEPMQARAMSLADIERFRAWHRRAVERAIVAGFDLVYVDAGRLASLPAQFLSHRFNRRRDQYGGAFEQRVRLLGEMIEDTLAAVDGRRAVAVRLAVDLFSEPHGDPHDLERLFERVGALPDLWEIVLTNPERLADSARFGANGAPIPLLERVRALTPKPIAGTRHYASGDEMVSWVERGVVDLVGCARQSIADPFLPRKLHLDQSAQIRTCIKCNICIAGDQAATAVRCTQNPTFGEEWRRGWHPEVVPKSGSDATVLVVGAGPAGLECALVLGQRGYSTILYERSDTLGGHVAAESTLPGMARFDEVIRWRRDAIDRLHCVNVVREREADAEMVLAAGYQHVVIATGARWRADGLDRHAQYPIIETDAVFTPSDVIAGKRLSDRVLVYDDDHYYMGGVLCEMLREQGLDVILLTPAGECSAWTHRTLEQRSIQRHLIELGVEIITHRALERCEPGRVVSRCVFTGAQQTLDANAVVLVTGRESDDRLYQALVERRAQWTEAGIESVSLIGDARVPGLLAQAIFSGHRHARELDTQYESNGSAHWQRDLAMPVVYRRGRRSLGV